MKITFTVVPPGGGEADYQFEGDWNHVPVPEDYVFKTEYEKGRPFGHEAFIVRRRWFFQNTATGAQEIIVEVEPAKFSLQSESHGRLCEMYAARGKPPREIQNSCY